jgi:6-pyruvoyl-tetrahydropterin synthase
MGFTIKYKTSFRAKHFLVSYKGNPEEIHDHTYTLVVHIEGGERGEEGFTVDFMEVKREVDKIIPDNGENLNEKFPFLTTTENIAEYFFVVLKEKFPLKRIELWEDDRFCVVYEP